MAEPSDEALDRYSATHWGIEPSKWFIYDDPQLPRELVVMGALKALNYTFFPENDDRGEECELRFGNGHYLVHPPTGPLKHHLYNLLTARKKEQLRRDFWLPAMEAREPSYSLREISKAVGGKRAGDKLPNVQAVVLGRIDEVFYFTSKGAEDDPQGGTALYVHEMGTEPRSSILPYGAVDAKGRLWWCGGNYVVDDAGIKG